MSFKERSCGRVSSLSSLLLCESLMFDVSCLRQLGEGKFKDDVEYGRLQTPLLLQPRCRRG